MLTSFSNFKINSGVGVRKMSEKVIFDQYLGINDYVAIFGEGTTSVNGYVQAIDEYFLHLQTENLLRLFRLSRISSFSVLKKYDPEENKIDRETEHIGTIISYYQNTLTGLILDTTEGCPRRQYFFHINHTNPTEDRLRGVLIADGWSGTKVHFRLGLNNKGVCAKEISMVSQMELEYVSGEQKAKIAFYSNSGKRGSIYLEDQEQLLPFHLGQVSSKSLAASLLNGRWEEMSVRFYFAYNGANLCADDIRENETIDIFDRTRYLSGTVTECISTYKNSILQIVGKDGTFFSAVQRDIADLRLYTLARDRWDFSSCKCKVLFLSDDTSKAKHVILDDELDEIIAAKIGNIITQWQYVSLPHKPTPIEELPSEMIAPSVFRRVREMNKNGNEDAGFELLEKYKKYLDPEKKKNWELVLAAHSKRHDHKLLELLKVEDEQTVEDDSKLPIDQKAHRATRLEMLRDAYMRMGEAKRAQVMADRVEILRFREDTGIETRCSTEVQKVEYNLKGLLCDIMPEIWSTMYPDGKGNECIEDWQEGYLDAPPADYNDIYNNRSKYKNFIRAHKRKYHEDVSLQAVLSLADVAKLIHHYMTSDWYERWNTSENMSASYRQGMSPEEIPCFQDRGGEKWDVIYDNLEIVIKERDRLKHADVNRDPVLLLNIYKKTLNTAKQINQLLENL